MDKLYKVTNPQVSVTSTAEGPSTDWSKCVLCQEDTTAQLRCPAESKRGTKGAGYATLASLLEGFGRIGCLPSSMNLARFDDGEGIEATLRKHSAKWHDTCRLEYNKTKLHRAQNRKSANESENDTCLETEACRAKKRQPEDHPEPRKFTRLSLEGHSSTSSETCFFCGESASDEPLCRASTFGIDFRVRQCAMKLQDKTLLAKLSAGDLIAQDAMYHLQCLVNLYNRARETKSSDTNPDPDALNEGIAFAELVSYIEEALTDTETAPIFVLADLVCLYATRLKQLGSDDDSRIHSTRLKERLLSYFPDLEAHKQGKNVVLIANHDIGSALRKACDHDADSDAVHLARAAKTVRRDMFKVRSQFNGSFEHACQEDSVPASLLALVSMVLNGPSIKAQSSSATPQHVLTISQLLMHNSMSRCREKKTTAAVRHSHKREPPLPIYLGIMLHTKTRKRELVDQLFELGLSISYDRVLEISTDLGNRVCKYYETKNAVCPPQLKHNLFTTAAVDNIDHNPSSISAQDSFHGTGISLFQHPDSTCTGFPQEYPAVDTTADRRKPTLPETYTNIPPQATLLKQDPPAKEKIESSTDSQLLSHAISKEYSWLEHLEQVLGKEPQEKEAISWAAYHAQSQQGVLLHNTTALTSLLPLFHDEAKSVAMIRHAMNVVRSAVEILNSSQVPIITCDQPLYALAKQIQWTWPSSHGEDRYVVMLGGLHIEMVVLKMLGDLLEDSGWTRALVQAGIATSGMADAFLKAAHVTRTRRVHQITASSLYLLMKKAHNDYAGKTDTHALTLEKWCDERARACPQFQFWLIILQLELHMLIFIRSIREGNFHLYIEALQRLVPWCFALDHTNYARWVPVHISDMTSLEKCHPAIYAEFVQGKFVVKKSQRAFSAIAIDQAHEQNNAMVKGDGGAVGLTTNPAALHRWMVSGPEMAHLINDFQASTEKTQSTDFLHHEQKKNKQLKFAQDVRSLSQTIEEMGNPFIEESSDLLVLDTRDIADVAVIDTVRKIEKLGLEQYEKFVEERLLSHTLSIAEPIKRNNLHLFSRPPARQKSSKQLQMSSLKNDCTLFSRLYIASQTRGGDLEEFFKHENQAYPPALSQVGALRSGTKSELVHCLESLVSMDSAPTVDVLILDGAAIVNMLNPGGAKTFHDYAESVILPYIESRLQNISRIDVVWDVYRSDSLKVDARNRRGKGIRRRVEATSLVPKNWQGFLRIDDNKTELFSFLAMRIAKINTSKEVITTHDTDVLCVNRENVVGLAPCTHEEADTRMLLHLDDAVKQGYRKVSIRTVDTDVVVLATAAAQRLGSIEVWIAFGTKKSFRHIPAHEIATVLGPNRCVALPMFHAFTGCDTVSFFGGRGKRTAWSIWKAFDEVTPAFCALAATPNLQSIEQWLDPLERFVVLLYDRTSSLEHVNDARKQLFTQKGRAIDGLPPTQAALIHHTRRAAYQAGHCWAQAMVATPEIPSPGDWGWKRKDSGWEVCWTTLPEASKACRELIRCGCKKECRGRCKCQKANLQCTALCTCGGMCSD